MNYYKYILPWAIGLFYSNCATSVRQKKSEKIVKVAQDKNEWELIVFDPQYDVYLLTIARSKDYFSKPYYRSKNLLYVNIWNARFRSGQNPGLYEIEINYDLNIDYGLDFEYRLYNFFKFVTWKYIISLTN